MTDEATGGKPRPFDKMRAGLLEALEYAKTDPMTHVTIPTAALTELLAAAEECAGAIDHSQLAQPSNVIPYPTRASEMERVRAAIIRVCAAVARVRGE